MEAYTSAESGWITFVSTADIDSVRDWIIVQIMPPITLVHVKGVPPPPALAPLKLPSRIELDQEHVVDTLYTDGIPVHLCVRS